MFDVGVPNKAEYGKYMMVGIPAVTSAKQEHAVQERVHSTTVQPGAAQLGPMVETNNTYKAKAYYQQRCAFSQSYT